MATPRDLSLPLKVTRLDCRIQMASPHSSWGQFCIDKQLAAALCGDLKKGLFFRGAGALPFGKQIRSVCELMTRMLTPPPAMLAG